MLKKLGITFHHLTRVFVDKFVPMLMTETLKNLRKAAELDMAGAKATGENPNAGKDLKEQLSKTTKATKMVKGQKVVKQEDMDEVIEVQGGAKDDQDSDEDDKHSEQFMDIDGIVKNTNQYDQAES